jgi:ribonucleoside-diphosphate reductase alpha chain/ribonucleoside-triphosphate reductase
MKKQTNPKPPLVRMIVKRDGQTVPYDRAKIERAIYLAMSACGHKGSFYEESAKELSEVVESNLSAYEQIDVDLVQDIVETVLMESQHKDAAKAYILYRYDKDRARAKQVSESGLLSSGFLSTFKHAESPMSPLGTFVYYRTYSRYLPKEGRREDWWETVKRAVEYNCSLVPTPRNEAEKLYKNVFELKQFLSGRTMWVGNTDVSIHYPTSNFNCSFQVIDNFAAFRDLFYLLMVGSGCGVRILADDVKNLPPIRKGIEVIHQMYEPLPKDARQDTTAILTTHNDTLIITVGDSKEGWGQAIETFMKVYWSSEFRKIKTIVINYDHVRPKGEKLKTFGGTASGHSSMKNMFVKIEKVFSRVTSRTAAGKASLRPIDCLDIANIIGENVVSGGVRRTAEIMLIDSDDKECIQAKSELYKKVGDTWVIDSEISHRQMSNNSIYYRSKPTREHLRWHLNEMRRSGEPGWVNAEAGAKRRPNFNGVNPCAEILLDSNGLCNLTTVNTAAFAKDGKLDKEGLLEAQRLSARAGYRMTFTELELPDWNKVQQRDKLIGCSLTGWQDMVNACNLTREDQAALLKELREAARNAAFEYADELGRERPILVTTVKPEGSLSLLPTVSSGVHYSHAPYYIRRIRISASDPLVKVCEELGYPVFPEVGQDPETCVTKVVEFPVKAPEGKVKPQVSALEQLENYKMFMENYVDHNCSITVHVRDHEWDDVEQWVWDNWDETVALSFLPYNDSFYEMLPFEAISKEEYEKRAAEMKMFSPMLLAKYEREETDLDIGNDGCESGHCPVR